MIFPKAKKIAGELDWHKTDVGVFGLYKGYFFNVADASLMSNPQFKYVIATTDKLSEEQKELLKTALETNKKELKFSTFVIEDSSISFQFIENLTFTKLKTVYALLDFLVVLFKKLDVPEQNKCHNCGTKDKINHYVLNDNGMLLCNSCFGQIDNSFHEFEREKRTEDKNYLTGFLGSLVFSIPGIIAWVLIAVYLERLASAMAMVIAFLGLKGYDYFNGKQGKFTKYVIVVSNIISILIANAMTVIAVLVSEGLSVSQSLSEFQTNQAAKDIFNQNTMISFILAFFIWIWLLFVLKEQKLSIRPADKFLK